MGEERSGASGHAVSRRAGGNCVAMASVRSVVLQRPEHIESPAQLPLFSSYAAMVMEQPELATSPRRNVKGRRSSSATPSGKPIGKGTPGTP